MSNARFTIYSARAVFDKRLTATEKLVLSALGTYADKEGWCYPSQNALATGLEVTRQTISGAIKHLVELGYVQTTVRTSSGRGKVGYNYRVVLDLMPEQAAAQTEADVKPRRRRDAPTSAPADVGAELDPMEAQADIPIERTSPTERSQDSLFGSKEPQRPTSKKPKSRKPKAAKPPEYDPAFTEIWRSWPARGRQRSDKAKAHERWKTGCGFWGADAVERAAKHYLSLADTKKDGWQFCCGLDVFMNGRLEPAVEAANEALKGTGRKVWSSEAGAFVAEM